jgi:homogentisate 1,2-dioxygenase
MRYVAVGEVPRKRHTQVRDNGRLLVEEVMGYEGFSGNESILYHLGSPCRIAGAGPLEPIVRDEWVPDAHVHRLADFGAVPAGGDPVAGRHVLMFNPDIEVSVVKPTAELNGSTATARATRSSTSTAGPACSEPSSAAFRSASATT